MVSQIVSVDTFDHILQRIDSSSELMIDVETTGLKPWHGDRQCGIGIAFDENNGCYLPFRHPSDNLPLTLLPKLWDALRRVPTIIGYNLKFDLSMLYQDGYRVPRNQKLVDLIMAARLCSTDKFADLSLNGQLSEHFGAAAKQYAEDFVEYLTKNKWKKTYHKAPADRVGEYCILDTLWQWQLKSVYEDIISETHQTKLWAQEQDVTYVLWRMEEVGVKYDRAYGEHKIPQLEAKIDNLMSEIYQIVGREFNIRSSPQLTSAMHTLGIYSPTLSPKTGAESWPKEVMQEIEHPVAHRILEIRKLYTMLGTYFKKILLCPDDTVHGQFKNWGAITGRLASAEPNMQNISKNVQDLLEDGEDILDAGYSSNYTEEDTGAVAVRRLFINRPGYRLYMLDYSQMEIRVFADYLRDPSLTELLEDHSFSFHEYVAERIWDAKKTDDTWDYFLGLAKNMNFGLIYGMGIAKLAKMLKCTKSEAYGYKDDYFEYFPSAGDFMEEIESRIENYGFVKNRFKRRYWLDSHRAYVALNYLVQGTSADIMKMMMVKCQKFIEENNCKSRILLQIHDELVFEVHESEEEWFPFEMQRILQNTPLRTPLPVKVSKGNPSWAQKIEWIDEEQRWEDE